ncbi:MAG: hypothetical protein OQK00_07975 [Rhodobacteraceae bacterium]|nr:hypothetical protein [Paracoccaceae bacterium]MCW9044147.1 hypothetical protein [Pseudopelagicola sp.]
MTNVLAFSPAARVQPETQRHAALMQSFASHRRFGDDVFWLKENAELLNILECTGRGIAADDLEAYRGFYAGVERRLRFFPQYYRFLLSICLDLEDLGMEGGKGEGLVAWVAQQGFARAELSDLQRLEARRLMIRRGIDPLAEDCGLEDRVRGFMARSAGFAMPNKKAAYELTHAVFYLSEYGRIDPQLGQGARLSLEFAGLLAFLEQNADLLAEICIALRFAGFEAPEAWETWLVRHTHLFAVLSPEEASVQDDYHEYLVCNWLMLCTGERGFSKAMMGDGMVFQRPSGMLGPLRELSECMYRLEDRSGDWSAMRPVVLNHLSEDAQAVLSRAEHSSDNFDMFFEGFARAGGARVVG